jgi:hypothetical protein
MASVAIKLSSKMSNQIDVKKSNALSYIYKIIKNAEHEHNVKRAKSKEEFMRRPKWTTGIKRGREYSDPVGDYEIFRWKQVREGTAKRNGRILDMHSREQWLSVRCLAPLTEEETPSMDTLVRRHLDKTVGKEANIPLTTTLLKSILDACAAQ